MHRTDDKKDGGNRLAGLSPAVSGPPGPTVIPFRRASSAASSGSAAGDDPLSSPASFESLGAVTQAVVMRLANKRLRLKVLVSTSAGEEDEGRDQS
ncbi:hypothetical protein G6M04_14545 [Agrobacterium rhizogenes]|uniref:hypothetical protein n=1 Tax=Rhizobium rhizogenes TaxID=359 RepID=UPI001573DF58|nr:hypothetical protein [Rhizobium rhizogenes]NTG48609.1 hypothetical protein [Rhizobium rhizogenes]